MSHYRRAHYFATWHLLQPLGSDPEIFCANSGFALIAAS
jgi:hypothetical protein